MNKGGIIVLMVVCLAIFGMGTLFSAMLSISLQAEDNIIIDGDDVISYNIINTDEIEIVTEDDIYIIDLYFDNEVVDFTVNSDIHIELERFDTRTWWWDFIINPDPVYPDEYRLGRIIKTPSEDGD